MSRRDKTTILACLLVFSTLIYGRTLWMLGEQSQLIMSIIFGLAIWELWTRRNKQINPSFKLPYSFFGGVIIASSTLINLQNTHEYLIKTFPFFAGVGLVLLGFSSSGMLYFWRELTILFFLGIPSVVSWWLVNPSSITAWFTTRILYIFGFDAISQGTVIYLFDKEVGVAQGCSGLNAMNYLLSISIVFLILFPIHGVKRHLAPYLAILIGFLGNAGRTTLLTYFYVNDMEDSFHYWHGGEGALLFGSISVILFSLTYWQFIRQDKKNRATVIM